VRRICNSSKRTYAMHLKATNMNKQKQNKKKTAVGSAWKLLQYCHVSDKHILRHLAGCVELLAVISEVLFIPLFLAWNP
jgi:hypothetical protein